MAGSSQTRLVILRGNSGSGKTTLARSLQQRLGHGQLAVISQDVVRREVLRARDIEGNPAVGLIDLMARYALGQGMSVVVEGILHPQRYGTMLRQLAHDHRGTTRAYFWDLPFEETVRRHTTKDKASEFGESEMKDWWYGTALVDGLHERTFGPEYSLDDAAGAVLEECGWS